MVPLTGPIAAQVRHEIRTALESHMKAEGLSQSDVADAIGTSATYINNLLTNASSVPEATRDRLLRDVNNWLEREARAKDARRPDDFVVTRVAERLMNLAMLLSERADMAVAYGPAGIGKSTTIAAVCAEIPTAVSLQCGHDTRTAIKFVRALYAALARRRARDKAELTLDDLVERLRMPPKISTRSLLILDDGHKLPTSVWPLLCELHDKAACSVLLIGTVDLYRRVSSDDDIEFGQLSSRIGMRVRLAPELALAFPGGRSASGKCFTVTDIRKLFARGKIRLHAEAVRMLCAIANSQRGTLRRVVRLYDWAERAAAAAHAEMIMAEHIHQAAELVEEEAALPALESEGA